MPDVSIPLAFALSTAPAPTTAPDLRQPLPRELRLEASDLLTDLIISAGAGASPYWISPPPNQASAWTCHGVDNATLAVAAQCPLVALQDRTPR